MSAPSIALEGSWGAKLRPQNFSLRAGDQRSLAVSLLDRGGAVAAVTGTFEWRVTSGPGPRDGIKTTKSGTVTAGEFTIDLDGSETTSEDGLRYHEAVVTDDTTAVSEVMFGLIRVGEVTT